MWSYENVTPPRAQRFHPHANDLINSTTTLRGSHVIAGRHTNPSSRNQVILQKQMSKFISNSKTLLIQENEEVTHKYVKYMKNGLSRESRDSESFGSR